MSVWDVYEDRMNAREDTLMQASLSEGGGPRSGGGSSRILKTDKNTGIPKVF